MPKNDGRKQPTNTGMTIMPYVLEKLDKLRGPVPRSWVIENAIIFYLNQVEKGRFTILQDFSAVSRPESPTEQPVVVKDNSPQHRPRKEDAVPVTS